jgi:hypothetical protein
MPVKSKANTFFNYGYLSAINASGEEIVFGMLQEFSLKSNLGLKELMDPDSLTAAAVGISEQKVTISAKNAKFKTEQLVLAMGGTKSTVAAVADPSVAPTLTAGSGSTSMTAGYVGVAYAYRTPYGTTKISPVQTVSITLGQKITVTAITLPAGATYVDLYVTSATYASAPLAAAAQLYKLGQIAGGAAYDIVAYALTSALTPPTVSQVGLARDIYSKSTSDEPLACRLQFFTEKNGAGMEVVVYGVVMPDFEFTAGLKEFVIPAFNANAYGDDSTGKLYDVLVPTGG